MSSKKYDANIGTTRKARASQQALLLSLSDLKILLIKMALNPGNLFLHIRLFKSIAFFLVFDFQHEGQEERQNSE